VIAVQTDLVVLGSMMYDRFLSALAKDRRELDWTAAVLNVSEEAGLKR
jgi:hypothetical protein